ncbi:MAG: class I SAM-dependent methyltransferase [Actinomycetota bacterium]|nr:class I SAM-dependent methyltransferase [Actinomycetota bacterium]
MSSPVLMTAQIEGEVRQALTEVLEDARRYGHLGPGPLDPQIDRSLALCDAVDPPASGTIVDLGSGGGLPGLVMAAAWPGTTWLLLDGRALRAAFLHDAVARLGWAQQVSVLGARAERAGRGPLRHRSPLVVARGFGPPGVTAECASPFLRPGGHLVVTDPPGGDDYRWPDEGLATVGLVRHRAVVDPVAFQVFRQRTACPERYPRRVGVPAKQPLF